MAEPMTDAEREHLRRVAPTEGWTKAGLIAVLARALARLDRAEARGAWRPTIEVFRAALTAWRDKNPKGINFFDFSAGWDAALAAEPLPEPPRAGEGGL